MDRIAMPDSKLNSALWTDGERPFASDSISADLEFDVAIIGGGFSGLWSAVHLLRIDSSLKIAIFESREIGFGASGRNGGWASTDYPVSKPTLIRRHGLANYELLDGKLRESLSEIGEFASEHAPAAGFVKSGTLSFARNRAQLQRLAQLRDESSVWLEGSELERVIRIAGARAGIFNPECATVQPYQLLTALANFLRGKGVAIFTNSLATICDGGVLVNSFMIKAPIRIAATEALGEPGNQFIPLYSLMVATEPLSEDFWLEIGNETRCIFVEYSHLINYAQRTSDNRLAIGGRGATYPFGSRLSIAKENEGKVHDQIRTLARSWFPGLADFRFTHAWGGAIAITRDWEPYVQWDERRGLARLGGYAGDGVTMSYLAAKVLSKLILNRQDEYTELHFVGRRVRRWEPEPIRYLAVNTLVKLSGVADSEERVTGRSSLLNRVISPLILR